MPCVFCLFCLCFCFQVFYKKHTQRHTHILSYKQNSGQILRVPESFVYVRLYLFLNTTYVITKTKRLQFKHLKKALKPPFFAFTIPTSIHLADYYPEFHHLKLGFLFLVHSINGIINFCLLMVAFFVQYAVYRFPHVHTCSNHFFPLLLAAILLCEQITIYSPILSLIHSFQFWSIINKASVDILIHALQERMHSLLLAVCLRMHLPCRGQIYTLRFSTFCHFPQVKLTHFIPFGNARESQGLQVLRARDLHSISDVIHHASHMLPLAGAH